MSQIYNIDYICQIIYLIIFRKYTLKHIIISIFVICILYYKTNYGKNVLLTQRF